jgi:hypothetical protein
VAVGFGDVEPPGDQRLAFLHARARPHPEAGGVPPPVLGDDRVSLEARPVVNLGPKRPLLWLRPEIEEWARRRPKRA